MTLSAAQKKFDKGVEKLEKAYLKDLSQWIKVLKPDAKAFEFDANWESDDEGGSDPYFSSLTIDDTDLETMVREGDLGELRKIFDLDGYTDEELEEDERDAAWDSIRDQLHGLPEFVYGAGLVKIDEL